MKRVLAVALLIMSFGAVAFADGSGQRPPKTVAEQAQGRIIC
ncbi:MAG: hypothetical protein WBX38_06145 [Candidatus Sulfotelmatobacter sp.]